MAIGPGQTSTTLTPGGTRRASLVLFGPAIAWTLLCAAGIGATMLDDDAWSAVDRSRSVAVGSARCQTCHPREHEAWFRSYHRTMTQAAGTQAAETQPIVLAPFAGEHLDALGFRAIMTGGPQRPHVRVERLQPEPGQDPLVLDADVELTVGSHRYQQYVARIDRGGGPGERWRLPVAWHVELSRWIHINGAFLTPEGAWGDEADYLRHLSRWNDNCIFCHNTEPVPGLDPQGQWNSEVAELGIGCEACHGPASAHVERHAWPLRRVLAGLAPHQDGSVAHPGRLSAGLSADVCGRCHGNRIAADLADVLAHGDGFLPGRPLSEVSRPILRDATLGDPPQRPFEARFWPDGTPRLSAYEYQALLSSPCHQDGAGLSCGDCHTMHGPEPSMQLWPEHDTSAVCGRCHEAATLSDAAAPGGHGRHGAIVGCEGCHLPRVTYGLLEGMMSHRPTRPRPQVLLDRDDQPDACTQCHVDRSRAWAAGALEAWRDGAPLPAPEPGEISRVALDLHGGDPIQRALAAAALTRSEAPADPRTRMAWLVDALEDDYPAVRWFGYRGLRRVARQSLPDDAPAASVLEALDVSNAMEDPGLRAMMVDQLRAILGPGPLAAQPELEQRLHERRDDRAIWIGE
ncbi:cytochrome c3 family protein [Paraliomyxa miuraensis]|uniref:cytochrome c3 family protein n=1 Tax=Paraliomyxa miuraensis TaxID=376150 RepID=UPI002256F162|nr:cytochrome c3 family protein [Paraliomyxa miuraensis]MCX4245947.1 cytochrome c family protein [Paraliomyxa miuraensis]